jgi:hypothetical protein
MQQEKIELLIIDFDRITGQSFYKDFAKNPKNLKDILLDMKYCLENDVEGFGEFTSEAEKILNELNKIGNIKNY